MSTLDESMGEVDALLARAQRARGASEADLARERAERAERRERARDRPEDDPFAPPDPNGPKPPPHEVDTECFVLTWVLQEARGHEDVMHAELARVFSELTPADFYHRQTRRLFRAMGDVYARGERIDSTATLAHIPDRDERDAPALNNLCDRFVTRWTIGQHIGRLRELTRARAVISTAVEIVAEGHRLGPIFDGFAENAAARLAAVAQTRGASVRCPPTTLEKIARLGVASERRATGIFELDKATRGGLTARTLTVIGGAPGAGKTTLVATNIARRYADAGLVAVIHASDEDDTGILVRIAQSLDLGLTREQCESPDLDVKAAIATELQHGRLWLVDQDADGFTVEDSAELAEAQARAHGTTGVLIVDSVQTARTAAAATTTFSGPRERIDATVRALRHAANARGLIVIATSEVSRAFYRGGGTDRIDPLAATKESGGIEYGASLLMTLTSVKDEPDLVQVEVAKNRIGGVKPTFRLSLDRATATFRDAEMPADDAASTSERASSAADARVRELSNRLVMELARRGSVAGMEVLRCIVSGPQALIRRAIAQALADGRIEGGGRGNPYRVRQLSASADASVDAAAA